MNDCLSSIIRPITDCLDYLDLYEPELSISQAEERLETAAESWRPLTKSDRELVWDNLAQSPHLQDNLKPLVKRAIAVLSDRGIQTGVAVDLGCGISSTVPYLLEHEWNVYAVDSAESVIAKLRNAIIRKGDNWIDKGQLTITNEPIENYEYPKKVHLIVATDAIPYCNPRQITSIFLKAKSALHDNGIFAYSFFPCNPEHPVADNMLRNVFGAWMTKKNVMEAVLKWANFSLYSITEVRWPDGTVKQFQVLASP